MKMKTNEVPADKPEIHPALNPQTLVYDEDLLEIVYLCNGALAQDSPYDKTYYLEQIMNRAFAYLSRKQRDKVDQYLANKDYLPPTEILIET